MSIAMNIVEYTLMALGAAFIILMVISFFDREKEQEDQWRKDINDVLKTTSKEIPWFTEDEKRTQLRQSELRPLGPIHTVQPGDETPPPPPMKTGRDRWKGRL